MAMESTEALRGVLFEAYDGFADKRLKDLTRDAPFIVDDRSRRDEDAQGRLFSWFCQMLVEADAPDHVRLVLRGEVPEGAAVDAWFQAHGARRGRLGLEVDLTPANVADLPNLSSAFASIMRAPYDVKAYKYVVPRVAGSLMRLHKVLSGAWA